MPREVPTDVALFRFEIIAPLLAVTGPRGTLKREIHKIAARLHNHPRRGLIKVGVGTIEEWLLRYRRDGLEGLEDKRRRDLGTSCHAPRSMDQTRHADRDRRSRAHRAQVRQERSVHGLTLAAPRGIT